MNRRMTNSTMVFLGLSDVAYLRLLAELDRNEHGPRHAATLRTMFARITEQHHHLTLGIAENRQADQAAHEAIEAELDKRQALQDDRDEQLHERGCSLQQQWDDADERSDALDDREAELDARSLCLDCQTDRDKLDHLHSALIKRQHHLDDQQAEQIQRHTDQEATYAHHKTTTWQLDRRAAGLAEWAQLLGQRDAVLTAAEAALPDHTPPPQLGLFGGSP